jgi:hypothetical protein
MSRVSQLSYVTSTLADAVITITKTNTDLNGHLNRFHCSPILVASPNWALIFLVDSPNWSLNKSYFFRDFRHIRGVNPINHEPVSRFTSRNAFIHSALRGRIIALPILLTIFTVGIVVGVSVYGFCIYRSGALRRSDTHYDDIEGGRHGGDTRIGILGTYSRGLGQSITRKFSAMSSQISRRPTAVVTTEKPDSFTIISEETSSPTPQEVSQPSSGGPADVVEPSSVIGVPIIPVHARTTSRPTSSVTVSTASGSAETGTGLNPPRSISTPNGKGLRPAPSRSSVRGQNRPIPIPPALNLSRQGTQRQYGLPTANNRLESMRPRSRSKSATIAEPNPNRVSSATRRRASEGVVAALDSPPAHFAQVPISALPTATPFLSNIRPYSRVSGHPSLEPGATIQGASRRRKSNTMGSIIMVQDALFAVESPISRFNQPTPRLGAEPRTSDTTSASVLEPFIIPSSLPRSEADSHIDPFYDIPQTATTTFTRYSMALPESGSLLPTPFSVAQDEVVPPLPSTSIPLPMLAKLPNRSTSPSSGVKQGVNQWTR